MGKNRLLVQIIQARLAEKQPHLQVVVGPRQVGKTTALQAALGTRGVYHSADYPTPLPAEVIAEWWTEAEHSPERILAIDEVQKITNWAPALKAAWDRGADIKVVVAGSSALLVEKGLTETLAGRFELIRAEHWNYQEAQSVFGQSVAEFIEFGCYPGAVPLLADISRWGAYVRDAIVEPALGRDLLQLHPVASPALLRQVFGAAVALPAQVLSLPKLQGNLQERGSLPTLQHYLRLLAHAFLVTGVEKYSASLFRSRKSSPKLIMHDNALLRAFERPITAPLKAERLGRYFENAIGARFLEAGWETFYWRHRHHEVDFVVIGPLNQRYAVEVKTAPTDLKGLSGVFEFCKIHPDFEPRLVSLHDQKIPGVETLAVADVLGLDRLSREHSV